jgi:4-amino-4-deoxy-L-arabinose transferase-like glycosyltransferase
VSSRQRKPLKAQRTVQAEVSPTPVLPRLERRGGILAVVLVLVASLRIAATYTVFNHTGDEPAHIACGMEWLDRHVYLYEPQHPPLARIAAALGPYAAGIRSQGTPGTGLAAESFEGAKILYRDHHYDLTLALARLGILPFFWVACLTIYCWGKRYYGGAVGLIALFFFSFLPPVLAHAGLATTDMALTAFLGAAYVAALWWAERPTWRRGLLFGAATGLAVISKFSSLVFFPVALAMALTGYLVFNRPAASTLMRSVRERLPSFGLAVATGALVILVVYRFSLSAFLTGIRAVIAHNAEGHPTYLLGRHSNNGFWYFYPVVLAVKTPLALLILLGLALWWMCREPGRARREWPLLALTAGILLVGLFSRINIGVRHILPVYFGFSLLAATAVRELIERARTRSWMRPALGILLVWFGVASLWCHPDYLAYTNELAQSAPEKVLADSDLDWGQDMKRLSARLRQAGAAQVTFDPTILADFEGELGFPRVLPANPLRPSPGWNAVSLSWWKTRRFGLLDTHPEAVLWPDRVPPGERVGKGVMLWYFPPAH